MQRLFEEVVCQHPLNHRWRHRVSAQPLGQRMRLNEVGGQFGPKGVSLALFFSGIEFSNLSRARPVLTAFQCSDHEQRRKSLQGELVSLLVLPRLSQVSGKNSDLFASEHTGTRAT